jgi:uncharacterized protein (TIGR00255 family)
MKSMTGFGRGSLSVGERRIAVEIRSVNHRGFDAKVRARDLDAAGELAILGAVRAQVARGSVVVNVREEAASAGAIDVARVRAVHAALESLRQELRLPGAVDLATVAAFLSGGVGVGEGVALGWDQLRPAVEQALSGLAEMRTREGAALAADLRQRAATLIAIVDRTAAAAADLPARAEQRLADRLAQLGTRAGVEPARLAQEVALIADRLDVSEEIVRLRTHLAQLERLLGAADGDEPAGRRIEFLLQEVGRELNTIASKAQDAQVAGLIIDGKAELEKIREQAQNIE